MVKKDLKYYWDHPKEYKRMTADDLKIDPTVDLCESILDGLREDFDCAVKQLKLHPTKENYFKALDVENQMRSKFVTSITFGHSNDIADECAKVRSKWSSLYECG